MNLIKRITTPPVFQGEEDKTIVAQSLHILLLAAIVVATCAFVVFAFIAPTSLPRVLATDLPILLVLLASWLLVQRGQVRVAAMLVVGIAWVGSTLSSVLAGGLKSSLFGVGSMLVVLLSGFLLGQWGLLGLIALNILTGIAIAWADTQGWIPLVPASVSPTSILMSYALNLFAAAAAMYVAINSLRSALDRARQELIERKLAEEALRESEAKFRTIIEQSSEGMLLVDETGKIIEWNQAYAHLTGMSSKQAIGLPLWDAQYRLLPPSRRTPERFQEIKTAIQNALDSGKSPMFNQPLEATIQTQDGKERHLVQNAFCIKTDKGNRIASLIRDVTESKRAENQVQQRLHELATVNAISQGSASQLDLNTLTKLVGQKLLETFDIQGVFVCVFDPETGMLSFPYWWSMGEELNSGSRPLRSGGLTSTIFSTRQPLLINQDYEKQFLELGGARVTNTAQRFPKSWLGAPMLAGEENIGIISVQNFEREHAFTEADVRLLITIAANVGIAIKNAQLYTAAQQELTERKRAEQALRESEALYQSLVSVLPMSLCRKDSTGRITFANQRYAAEFHLLQEEMVGKTDFDLHPHELAEKYRQDDRQVMETGRAIEIVEEHVPIGGTTSYVHVFKTPVRDAFGNISGVQIMFWDITEQKLAEAERESLIRELEAKNAELERFTYTVSHDLKSPLITIRGFLGFLEQDVRSGNMERMASDMGRIVNATNKMQQLLNDLLELSRIGRMMNPPEDVPFTDIVRDAIELVRGRLTANNIRITVAEDLPTVRGDRARLIEVAQNLIDNAAKFIGNQTQPTIDIGVRGAGTEGKPIFFVRDNGIGIDTKYHERVFGLFNKLDAQSEGTGVGLALVKRIVEVHGGKIWVESEGPGQGTTFCFTLANASS